MQVFINVVHSVICVGIHCTHVQINAGILACVNTENSESVVGYKHVQNHSTHK